MMTDTAKATCDAVFDCAGILEYVFIYCDAKDLIVATEVSIRWKDAGRSDFLWKEICSRFWEEHIGMKKPSNDEDLPLFWRSCLSDNILQRLSVRQIRSFFSNFLLRQQKKQLEKCVEKYELLNTLKKYRDENISNLYQFDDLWFGSFCSSVADARRTVITKEELCNPYGFDMYFKILEEEIQLDTSDLEDIIPYEGRPGIMLYRHSVCYFDQEQQFELELKNADAEFPSILEWRWVGQDVQVGPYPVLEIVRLPNWGWKLENVHVVLIFRETRVSYSRRR